jgi:metallo-beta-lactamase family protein
MEWVGHFESKPQVFLVHGEVAACEALAKKIKEKLHLTIHIPRWKEQLILKPRKVAIEKPAVEEPVTELKTVLLNTIQDVENELKELRKRIKSKDRKEELGEAEVDRLKYIQEELQALMEEP